MSALKKDAYDHPIYHAVIIFLLAVGLFSLPMGSLFSLFMQSKLIAEWTGGIALRLLIITVSVVLIVKYGFNKTLKSFSIKGFLLVLPAFLVAINNAPIISFILGRAKINASAAKIALYAVYCLSIGVSEELVFFGLIFPLISLALKNKKNSLVISVAICACAVSLSHVTNFFSEASFGEISLQIFCVFLISAAGAIVKLYTKNLFIAGFMHALYDFGGLMLGNLGIGSGQYFITLGIIVTAIIGALVGAYMLILLIKENNRREKEKYKKRTDLCKDKVEY